jgi:hypothetical protein
VDRDGVRRVVDPQPQVHLDAASGTITPATPPITIAQIG